MTFDVDPSQLTPRTERKQCVRTAVREVEVHALQRRCKRGFAVWTNDETPLFRRRLGVTGQHAAQQCMRDQESMTIPIELESLHALKLDPIEQLPVAAQQCRIIDPVDIAQPQVRTTRCRQRECCAPGQRVQCSSTDALARRLC